jgi:hypothetical protein
MDPLISVAAQVFPSIISAIVGDKGGTVATQVAQAVTDVTGAKTANEATQKVTADPKVAADLQVKLAQIALDAHVAASQQNLARDALALDATKNAQAALATLAATDKPLAWTPTILSYIVVVGFFLIVVLLMTGVLKPAPTMSTGPEVVHVASPVAGQAATPPVGQVTSPAGSHVTAPAGGQATSPTGANPTGASPTGAQGATPAGGQVVSQGTPQGTDLNQVTVIQIVNICIGAIATAFATVIQFWLGSSLGSRNKDNALIQGHKVAQIGPMLSPPGSPPTVPGSGTGPAPGSGTGPAPGSGTGPTPGSGTGPTPGSGTGPTPGSGTGPTPSGPLLSGKGSWYSQYQGKYIWIDNGDAPNSNALGVSDADQGVSFFNSSTLGKWFEVHAPNGVVSIEQQTDIGPASSTGRSIDISAAAAERFGYSPKNFPTDGIFQWWPIQAPASVASLSPAAQGVAYAKVRGSTAPTPSAPTPSATVPPWVVKGRTYAAGSGLVWSTGSGPMPATIIAWLDNVAATFPQMATYVSTLKTQGEKGWFAWCGVFVQCMLSYSSIAGPISAQGIAGETTVNDWAYVDAWKTWGTKVWDNADGDISNAQPQVGDVLIWNAPGIHHISFYDHPEPTTNTFASLGGDQGKPLRACIEDIDMSYCVAIRRPPT